MEILETQWYTLKTGECIGIVKINTGFEVKTYIGKGLGLDEKEDTEIILKSGVPFYGQI